VSGHNYQCAMSVIKDQSIDMLFGLDMLRRHQVCAKRPWVFAGAHASPQCCIDLKDNVLRFGTTGASTTFLAEHGWCSDSVVTVPILLTSSARADIPRSFSESESEPSAPVSAQPVQSLAPSPPAHEQASSSQESGGSDVLATLVGMGYPRDLAAAALRSANGDVSAAITMLISMMQ
jgi:hypothetical protein